MKTSKQTQTVVDTHDKRSDRTANCFTQCTHGCIYCPARYGIEDRWPQGAHKLLDTDPISEERECDLARANRSPAGRVVFPTRHDITPGNMHVCEPRLIRLLQNGSDVMIATKPAFECIVRLCLTLSKYKSRVSFRFGIGWVAPELGRFWEPGLPEFDERLDCLRHAFEAGYETNVSATPLLDPWNIMALVDAVRPYVTGSVRIGKLDQLDLRTRWRYPDGHRHIELLREWQTDQLVLHVVEGLQDDPLIQWNSSYRKVIEAHEVAEHM